MADNGITLPIKSYTELLAASEKLKAAGVIPMSISNKEGWTAQILGLDQQWAGLSEQELTDLKAGTLSYKDMPSLVTLLTDMKGLQEKGFINPEFMSTTMDMAIADVATGKAAMTPAGDWSYATVQTNHPDVAENVGMMSDETLIAMYDVEPGICPVQGLTVKGNSWNTEMTEYSKTIPLAKIIPALNGFSTGDFATSIQALYGGKTVQEALEYCYDDCVQVNKAATVAILIFMNVWNDFGTQLYFGTMSMRAMPLSVYGFFGRYSQSWNLVFADIILTMLPVVFVYMLGQKYIISGMTAGAVKG